LLSAGQVADIEQASSLIEGIQAAAVIADKGYDSDALVQTIQAAGALAVIPPRSHRKQLRHFDPHLYKDRNLIERFFNRLKQFRRVASRFEKLALNYLSILNLVCAYIWLA
jgi:transposase